MKKRLILSLIMVPSCLVAQRIKTVSVELVEEKFNGKLFTYRIDVVNGVKKEQWTIAGKKADRDTYESELLFEKLQEEKDKREKEYQERVDRLAFKEQQKIALSKKLLKKEVEQVQNSFDLFEKHELSQYYAFDTDSIASEIDFLNIPTQALSPAQNYLTTSDDDFECEKAEEYINQLQAYSKKLTSLFEGTLKRAISECEDTQKLKDLLALVS